MLADFAEARTQVVALPSFRGGIVSLRPFYGPTRGCFTELPFDRPSASPNWTLWTCVFPIVLH